MISETKNSLNKYVLATSLIVSVFTMNQSNAGVIFMMAGLGGSYIGVGVISSVIGMTTLATTEDNLAFIWGAGLLILDVKFDQNGNIDSMHLANQFKVKFPAITDPTVINDLVFEGLKNIKVENIRGKDVSVLRIEESVTRNILDRTSLSELQIKKIATDLM